MNFLTMLTMMKPNERWSCISLQRGKWSLHLKMNEVGVLLLYYDLDNLPTDIPLRKVNYMDKSWILKESE